MGAGTSNNQLNNFRMLSVLQEYDRIKTEPSEMRPWEDMSVDYFKSNHRVKLQRQTNLLDLLRVRKSPMRLKNNKTIDLKKPYLEFAKTNLIDLARQNRQEDLQKGELSMEKYMPAKESAILSSQRLKPRRSLQVQNTLEVVQTSRLEKSVNEEGLRQLNQYTLVESLGQGAFGKVKKATNFKAEVYAIKIANKKKLKKKLLSRSNAYTMLEREIAIMKKINHPNVVQLYEVIDDPQQNKLYLVMEYMGRGSVLSKGFFRNIKARANNILDEIQSDEKSNKLTEEQCRHYFRDFILGLEYLHEAVGVIHRDIKPENLLVNEQNLLKIADFGVSHIMDEGGDKKISSQQGTQAYLAPEVFKNTNFEGKPVDIWAGGVTLYQMVYNKLPFTSQKSTELRQQILEEQPPFPQPPGFSPTVVKLLKGLLEKNPEKRLQIHEITEDDWITEFGRSPLLNEYVQYEEVNEIDIRMALTSLNVQMALKIVVRLLCLAKKARKKIAERKMNGLKK